MATRSFRFGISRFQVLNCRSRGDHNDSDWLTVTVSSERRVLPPQQVVLGDNLHAGDSVGEIMLGPFDVDDQDTVAATFAVVNLRGSHDQAGVAAQTALDIAGKVSAVLGGLEAEHFLGLDNAAEALVLGAVGGVVEALGFHSSDPDCQGPVATRIWTWPKGVLPDSEQSYGPFTETEKSPTECGNDPHAEVLYLARPESVAAVPAVHEFLAGVNADHSIQVFQYTPGGGWSTGRIGWASVSGAMTSWVAANVWHLGVVGTDGNVYVMWQSAGQDWQAANISTPTGAPAGIQPPLTSWVVGEHEFLAGVNADHSIQVFQYTPGGGWSTGRIGWASVSGAMTSWVAANVWHLGVVGTDGNVYVMWQSDGRDWQAANISTPTAARAVPPLTAWVVGDVEHLAGLDSVGQPVVFWWAPNHEWQATHTAASDKAITTGLKSWVVPL